MKKVTTQTHDPQTPHAEHIACLHVDHELHDYVDAGGFTHLIVTHRNAWEHWRGREDQLQNIREAMVVGSGDYLERDGIACRNYRSAHDIVLHPHNRYLWLRGNKFTRNFAVEPRMSVTSIQTYHTHVHLENCVRVKSLRPDILWVYDHGVLKHLEEMGGWSGTLLYHVASAAPTRGIWGKTRSFYPGEENYAL